MQIPFSVDLAVVASPSAVAAGSAAARVGNATGQRLKLQ
jgi:hypothetical protein